MHLYLSFCILNATEPFMQKPTSLYIFFAAFSFLFSCKYTVTVDAVQQSNFLPVNIGIFLPKFRKAFSFIEYGLLSIRTFRIFSFWLQKPDCVICLKYN